MKPLAIDLFCGLGGWAEGFLAEGYDVIGFDLERHHDYGTGGYPGQLVLQDVSTLDGHQFRNAAVIVASPPCQEYSYMAMPWSRGKAKAAAIREDVSLWLKLTCLFNCCFRIAHEAGVPLVVENVRGAEPWVGPARWHFGSFYLWGDVPALMPTASVEGTKAPGNDTFARTGKPCGKLTDPRYPSGGVKGIGDGFPHYSEIKNTGTKQGGQWWHDPKSITRRTSSHSPARKAASAMIAKIPYPLAQHIARVFKP